MEAKAIAATVSVVATAVQWALLLSNEWRLSSLFCAISLLCMGYLLGFYLAGKRKGGE